MLDILQEALHAEVRKGPLHEWNSLPPHTPSHHRHIGTSRQKKEHCFRADKRSPGHYHVSNTAFGLFQNTSTVHTVLELNIFASSIFQGKTNTALPLRKVMPGHGSSLRQHLLSASYLNREMPREKNYLPFPNVPGTLLLLFQYACQN